ncbi:MAG: HypC/HybG/HupF family hydrogenase formation chaperone [Gemmatimonadota bacterium]|nr:HypC/HybG/HupF family hydrogenase formation chaperone [Gemmatimonadota bacterium]
MCLGIPGQVVEMYGTEGLPMGVVDFGGVRREVCLAYVADEIEVGDWAIVHVGFAISRLDEEEARRTWEALAELGELDELEWTHEIGSGPPSGRGGDGGAGGPAGEAGA